MLKNSALGTAAIALVVGLVVGFFVGAASKTTRPAEKTQVEAPAMTPKKTDVTFVNHIQAKLPEQDVFIQSDEDSKKVVRVEGDTEGLLTKKVYAADVAIPHDPFKVGKDPLGPFNRGATLGFTLGDWLAATGNGTYTVEGDKASLDLNFKGLVPDGVYTVWCSRITFPPNPAVVDRPCGKADGSENSFKTDADGNGTFSLSSMTPLEESTKETASVIALAYHSDSKTYGANPGDFGLNSHVQLFFLVPAPTQ